jgi:hypothetical protein
MEPSGYCEAQNSSCLAAGVKQIAEHRRWLISNSRAHYAYLARDCLKEGWPPTNKLVEALLDRVGLQMSDGERAVARQGAA